MELQLFSARKRGLAYSDRAISPQQNSDHLADFIQGSAMAYTAAKANSTALSDPAQALAQQRIAVAFDYFIVVTAEEMDLVNDVMAHHPVGLTDEVTDVKLLPAAVRSLAQQYYSELRALRWQTSDVRQDVRYFNDTQFVARQAVAVCAVDAAAEQARVYRILQKVLPREVSEWVYISDENDNAATVFENNVLQVDRYLLDDNKHRDSKLAPLLVHACIRQDLQNQYIDHVMLRRIKELYARDLLDGEKNPIAVDLALLVASRAVIRESEQRADLLTLYYLKKIGFDVHKVLNILNKRSILLEPLDIAKKQRLYVERMSPNSTQRAAYAWSILEKIETGRQQSWWQRFF